MFTAGHGIRINAKQRQDSRCGCLNAIAVKVDVINQGLIGGAERLQHGNGKTGIAARCVDCEIDVFPELCDPLARLSPLPESFLP